MRLYTSSDELYLSGADQAPPRYRPLVDEYFRAVQPRLAFTDRSREVLRVLDTMRLPVPMAVLNPPAASILRGVTMPPYGGDTQFTNLAAAYNALSPRLRTFLDTLRAVHGYGKVTTGALTDTKRPSFSTEHPLVRVHPETGERVLFVSPAFLRKIVGLTARESQLLLEMLWEHCVRPEFVARFRWNAGDIAIWDNRATAHLAPEDIFDTDFDRQLYRVTLVGDVPVGVDGKFSTPIVGGVLGPAEAAQAEQ